MNPDETPGDGVDNDGNGYVDDVHGYNWLDMTGDITSTAGVSSYGTATAEALVAIFRAFPTCAIRIMVLQILDASGHGFLVTRSARNTLDDEPRAGTPKRPSHVCVGCVECLCEDEFTP